jgi:hypothetical protein
LAQGDGRAVDEVALVGGHAGRVADEFEAAAGQAFEGQAISKRDGLEEGADFVVAVGAPALDAEAEVDLGEGGEREFSFQNVPAAGASPSEVRRPPRFSRACAGP